MFRIPYLHRCPKGQVVYRTSLGVPDSCFPSKIPHFDEEHDPTNTWFLGSTRVCPAGVSIGSAFFAHQLTVVQTQTRATSVEIGRIYPARADDAA